MVDHKQVFEELLYRMHPAIAEQRLAKLSTEAKLLKVLPFNGDHLGQLRLLLQSIVRKGKPGEGEITNLNLDLWPDGILQAMNTSLQTAVTPISNDELRLACLRFLNARNCDILKHPIFRSDDGNSILQQYYAALDAQFRVQKRDTSDKRVLNNINGVIRKLTPAQKETLYYALLFTSGRRPPYFPAQMLRLAMACDADVAKQALPHLDFSCQPWGIKRVVTCLKRAQWSSTTKTRASAGTKWMDPNYTAELYGLLQRLEPLEAEMVFTAVRRAHARLHYMPRYLAQNYLAVVSREPHACRDAIADLEAVLIHSRFGSRKREVEPLLRGLADACGGGGGYGAADAFRVVPAVLFDASVRDLVIDLNNALIEYMQDEGWGYNGEWISKD
ncbi:uncharacterized protein PG998_010061 [Apiospora kogelbergensis]|uniref:Uncharacterized protein n=1 Tax=Apiospora kogelbergensis TaxID=1337665 RepID=A0AAW0R9S4_9PEZI